MYGTITAKDGLRLRKGPGTKNTTLDLMPFGDRVEYLEEGASPVGGGTWLKIAWLPAKGARLIGWAAAEYIRLEQPKPLPEPEPEPYTPFVKFAIGLGIAGIVLIIIFISR